MYDNPFQNFYIKGHFNMYKYLLNFNMYKYLLKFEYHWFNTFLCCWVGTIFNKCIKNVGKHLLNLSIIRGAHTLPKISTPQSGQKNGLSPVVIRLAFTVGVDMLLLKYLFNNFAVNHLSTINSLNFSYTINIHVSIDCKPFTYLTTLFISVYILI